LSESVDATDVNHSYQNARNLQGFGGVSSAFWGAVSVLLGLIQPVVAGTTAALRPTRATAAQPALTG
jgi:hypothetical protein